MNEGVIEQQVAARPEEKGVQTPEQKSDKELNFRKLEASRDLEREARVRAEMQAEGLRREIETIKTMLQPKEKDPLDEIEDIQDLDRDKLKSLLAKREALLQKKFDESLPQKLEEFERNKRRTNFRDELRRTYADYDSVMNPEVIANIQEREPEAVEAISSIEDPYVRCEKAYHFFKKRVNQPQQVVDSPSIKEKVQENLQNTYFIPSGQGTPPPAVDFDVRSKAARTAAYDKLKAAQRRPLGNGQAMRG